VWKYKRIKETTVCASQQSGYGLEPDCHAVVEQAVHPASAKKKKHAS